MLASQPTAFFSIPLISISGALLYIHWDEEETSDGDLVKLKRAGPPEMA